MENNESIFNSQTILAYARRQATGGLPGSDELSARLELICRLIERHNSLNNLGRKVLIRGLAHNLINNFAIRQSIARDPSIACEPLPAPVFITGLPRTGTSLMHRLMALDENNRSLKLHEALMPAGSAEKAGYRKSYAETWSGFMNRIMPNVRHMIEVNTESPIECCFLKRNSLLCHSLSYQASIGDLGENWLRRDLLEECYDLYRLQLQLIQRQSLGGRWLLKCPSHYPAIELVYSRFPDAVIVTTSRDISEVISSFTSLISTIRSNLSSGLSKDSVALELMHNIRRQIEMHRESGSAGRATDISYADLARDPVGCVSEIYHRNGLHYTAGFENKMSDWLRKNPHQKNGKHEHSPFMFGLSRTTIHEFFESAIKRIGMAEPIN